MTTEPISELSQFHSFLGVCLEKGESLSPEEALEVWRMKNPSQAELEASVEEVRRALADMDAGNIGEVFADFDRRFRAQHGLSNS